ncbi:MAG: hypothetical protein ACRDAM_22610 [Casimicrobium sp.]
MSFIASSSRLAFLLACAIAATTGAVAQSSTPSIEIKAIGLKGNCYPAPAGTAYVGGVAFEMKNVGKATIEPQGVKLLLALTLDGKKVQTMRVSNPKALDPGKTAFTVVNGVGEAWFAITAGHVIEHMNAKSLAKPPLTIPAALVVDSLIIKDMNVKLVGATLNAPIVKDETLCGARPK